MSILSDLIALEEDITTQVQDATANAIGRGSSVRQNPAGFNGNRDMNQTDDIFGLQDNGNTPNDNPAGEEDNLDTDDGEGIDENDADFTDDSEDEDGNNDPNLDSEEDTADDTDSNEPPTIFQKNKLRNNMILFYNIVSNNIKLVTDSISQINDPSMIGTCNKVLTNLRMCKKYLAEEIHKGLAEHPYEESLRKYVALRRVYDISIEILDKHFGNASKK